MVRHIASQILQRGTAALFMCIGVRSLSLLSSPVSLKYECLVDRNTSNNRPEDLIQQTFFGELQRVVQLDLPKSSEIHQPQDETVLLTHIQTCDATENEDHFWEYSAMRPEGNCLCCWQGLQPGALVFHQQKWTHSTRRDGKPALVVSVFRRHQFFDIQQLRLCIR